MHEPPLATPLAVACFAMVIAPAPESACRMIDSTSSNNRLSLTLKLHPTMK